MRRLLARLGWLCSYCCAWDWTGWVLGGVSLTDLRPGKHFRFCRRCGEEQWRDFFAPPRNRMPDAEYCNEWSHEAREQRREEFDAATWGEFRKGDG